MDNKKRYQRSFLIFGNEESGFGAGQEPSGYVKIEVKDGKGRLSLSVSNLKEDQGRTGYKLYILKFDNRQCVPVCMGDLILKRNKSEMTWDFDPQNVNSSQISADEFNIAAVVAINPGKDPNELVCPLVAYKGEKVKWKDKAKDLFHPVKPEHTVENEGISTKQDAFSKYQSNITSKYTGMNKFEKNVYEMDTGYPDSSNEDTCSKASTYQDDGIDGFKEEKPEESVSGKEEEIKSDEGCPDTDNESLPQPDKAFDPCINCPAKSMNDNAADNALNLDKLKESFDRCFEVFDPFRSSRKNYIWWKVDNPTGLNNILYSFNLKNPLLLNPRVLMAYYKYRHLAVGIFDEITGSRKYIVCGIPAVYGVDDRPFGAACKWGQAEGIRARYGSFGYWLVYLDTKTGRIIS